MKKLKKIFAMMLTISMMMSLLSVNAFAKEDTEGTEKPVGNFKCEYDYEHQHDDCDGANCELTKLVCEKHVHDDTCYTEDELTCGKEIAQDLICKTEEHTHSAAENCWHKHRTDCYALKCELNDGDLVCEDESCTHETEACRHKHVGACYENDPSCEYAEYSEDEIDENLECEIEEHIHVLLVEAAEDEEVVENEEEPAEIEEENAVPCYEYHAHSVEKQCYACSIEPHAHARDCLTEDAENLVAAVEDKLTAAPTLAEMQAARGITYADTKNYPAETAAADYSEYIKASFVARDAAQEAYDALDKELQKLVNADLVKKLMPLETVFNEVVTANVTKGKNAYTFQSIYAPGYEMSNHVFVAEGKRNQIPELLMLVDASENKTWSPDSLYSCGYSNYEVLYCCDIETDYHNGIHYKRLNLEESGYYDTTAAERIRGIVTNSYPYISLEKMKRDLAGKVEDAENLTRGDVIAAVQLAIWRCANGAGVEDYNYARTFDINHIPENWSYSVHNYANEMYEWWNVGKKTQKGTTTAYWVNEDAGNRVDSLVEYLSGLSGVTANKNEVVITKVEVIGKPIPVLGGNGTYEVALKVQLNSSGSGEKDALVLTGTAGGGDVAAVSAMDVVYGQTEYVMLVTAAPNDEIVVELSGTQFVPKGAYFYAPEPADGEDEDDVATTREASQNLVGVAMGDTDVYSKKSLIFEMEAREDPVSISLNLLKVNETGDPLAEAEFALGTDLDDDGEIDPFKTYTTDENGEAVIDGLLPNVEYVLTETKAPAGYGSITGEIKFTVEQEDLSLNMMFNLPNGVTCNTAEDEQYVLTVVNCETPSGGNGGNGGTVVIPNPEIPLVPMEPEVPAVEPELEVIPDTNIPLADVPKTGDLSALWLALSALSGTGLAGVSIIGRKKKEED